MTDREFKRLSRSQLIDIIYQLQLEQNKLTEENQKLKAELADKRIRLRQAGNIAEASLSIHNVMQAAQDAAAQYLEEIRILKAETEKECRAALADARKKADAIANQTGAPLTTYDSAVEAILNEYKSDR